MDFHGPEDSLGTHSYLIEMVEKMFLLIVWKDKQLSRAFKIRKKPNLAKVTSPFLFNTTDCTHVITNKIHMI